MSSLGVHPDRGYQAADLYIRKVEGEDTNGKLRSRSVPVSEPPTCMEYLSIMGRRLPEDMFKARRLFARARKNRALRRARPLHARGPKLFGSRPRALALLALVALLAACDTPQAEQVSVYPVLFRSVSEEGEPLPGVQVLSGGEGLGITGPEASLSVQLQGREGSEVSFEPRCPQGTKPLGEPAALRLRTLGNGPAPEVELGCGRDKRMAALIVSAPGFADLPVLVHEREVTRTDQSGTAHLLLEGEQNTPLRVVLDTGARPRIVPPSPHKDVHIGTRDEIVVFTPGLVEPPAPVKKKHVKKAKPPPPTFRPEKL